MAPVFFSYLCAQNVRERDKVVRLMAGVAPPLPFDEIKHDCAILYVQLHSAPVKLSGIFGVIRTPYE